jgi:Na+/H+ antiporter NhaD/arsenite permease-like protein
LDPASCPDPREAIKSKKAFATSCVIFGCAVVLLVTHAQTGLTVSCIGVLVGAATLLTSGKQASKLLRQVDWHTLLFFIGLFVVISGLEQTGVLELLASFIGKATGGNVTAMIAVILWGSAVASAFVDNIPFAATMIPVIRSLSVTEGIDLPVLAWTLSMGTDIGGNATPIGASANVVGTSIAAKNGHHISWGRYCRSMAPATVLVIAISMTIIFIRYF